MVKDFRIWKEPLNGLFRGSFLVFTRKNKEKPLKLADLTEIRTGYLQNKNENGFHSLHQSLRFVQFSIRDFISV
jgi:hypothetical protein